MKKLILWGTFLGLPVLLLAARSGIYGLPSDAGQIPADHKLLTPISHGDLTIFPVVAAKTHDTSGFLTLDEGIRSGEVVVTEVGAIHGMIRRRPPIQN